MKRLSLAVAGVAALMASEASAAPLAFPGAAGFGAAAKGGRGGAVYQVTNLNDSGSGSLRACAEASGPRTCVFRIGGTIELQNEITVSSPYLTIAGQTAPGGGIQLRLSDQNKRRVLRISASDVVIRHLRLRRGATARSAYPSGTCCGDTVAIQDASRVILDHVSLGFATDENLDLNNAQDVTVQNSIIAYGLRYATDNDTVSDPAQHHSMGTLVSGSSTRFTLYKNLLAFNMNRNPRLQAGLNDVRGNVIYGAQFNPITADGGAQVNVVGNTFDPRPGTGFSYVINTRSASAYAEGNDSPVGMFGSGASKAASAFALPYDLPVDAGSAKSEVLAKAGAQPRDSLDQLVVGHVKAGSGSVIDSPSDVGGWPELGSGKAPADVDKDGMDDLWESANGLNPGNANDRNADRNGDGYTNLEEYLASLVDGSGTTGGDTTGGDTTGGDTTGGDTTGGGTTGGGTTGGDTTGGDTAGGGTTGGDTTGGDTSGGGTTGGDTAQQDRWQEWRERWEERRNRWRRNG
ncbi:hypothetical protein SH611_00845 [Geminicoccaceae bacterium 1502E]|nr:hypothetical protein [Geminicoccaceae bacterium 1502E]